MDWKIRIRNGRNEYGTKILNLDKNLDKMDWTRRLEGNECGKEETNTEHKY